MDTADFASALEAAHLSKSLLLARLSADSPVAAGECLFCETPLSPPAPLVRQPMPRRMAGG